MYSPAEDSYLLSNSLKKYLKERTDKNIKILDMGSGTGIQAETCKKLGFKNLLCADIDNDSVNFLKKKFKAVKSDLFKKIKGKFDLIIFNPPYLPEDKYDKKLDTTGGKKGCETIIKFLSQAKEHLNEKGAILLLFSSFSSPKIIKKQIKNLNLKVNLLAEKNLFFEKLFIIEIKKT